MRVFGLESREMCGQVLSCPVPLRLHVTSSFFLSSFLFSRCPGEDSDSPRIKSAYLFPQTYKCGAALSSSPESRVLTVSSRSSLCCLCCRGHWWGGFRTVAPPKQHDRDITVYHLAAERAVLNLVPTTCRGDVVKKRTSTEGPRTRHTPPHCRNHCWGGDDCCSVPARSRED